MGRDPASSPGVIRRRRVLILIVMAPFLFGASSEVPDRLTTPFLLQTITMPHLGPLDPVAWFGLSSYVTMALGFALLEVVRRTVNTTSDRAVAGTLVVLQGLYVRQPRGLRPGRGVRLRHGHALGPRAPAPRQRSAAERLAEPLRALPRPGHGLSFGGQMDAVGQMIGGPCWARSPWGRRCAPDSWPRPSCCCPW